MLRQRHKSYVEYLVSGGGGMDTATPEDIAEVEDRVHEVDAVVSRLLDSTRQSSKS